MKQKINITINKEVLKLAEGMIDQELIVNRSHLIELAIKSLLEQMEAGK